MIEIESPLRPGTLQSLFEIASWVDSKLAPPRKPLFIGYARTARTYKV
jgi:hypothetical protein